MVSLDTDSHSLEFAIANVQCQYDSPSDSEAESTRRVTVTDDHTYGTKDEPPAFIIQHVKTNTVPAIPPTFLEIRPKIMTISPGSSPSVNLIQVRDQPQVSQSSQPMEYHINKRIRRSEVVLRQAADCVSRGSTFQTVSEQFNIPISTIRFFMARKGILPKRRRGRTNYFTKVEEQPQMVVQTPACSSPEPPFHMQHFKLPEMVALKEDDEEPSANT